MQNTSTDLTQDKEIYAKILSLKDKIKTFNLTNKLLTAAICILSVMSSFAVTNYLLNIEINNTASTLHLTTNFWFLTFIAIVIAAICIALKNAMAISFLYNSLLQKQKNIDINMQKRISIMSIIFLFVVYILNLLYYADFSGFSAFFISLLFVGSLYIATAISAHFSSQIKISQKYLEMYERENVIKQNIYKAKEAIRYFLMNISDKKILSIKNNLLNSQFKMTVEVIIGILTSPFLAYGVSNTLAGCFPEAANWVRISGLRFSPVFLVLATFLIIFAFFSFTKAFSIGKQIKGSEIIKSDGFIDYKLHGIKVYGHNSIQNFENEKMFSMVIACFIIVIEFTMNVSYFITEIGADAQGMFLSVITALVPTALLIAETNILASTIYKIHNLNELVENLE